MKLYQIANDYEQALNELSDAEGIMPEILDDTLAHLKEPLEQKILNLAAYIKNIDSETKAMRDYEKAMAERRKKLENKAKNIKSYISEIMQRTELSKVSGTEFDVSVRKGAYSAAVLDEKVIPDEFVRTKREIDKMALREALKKGEKINGAHLEQSLSLVIS